MKFSKKTVQGALNQDKAKACKTYASALPRNTPVAIVDGGADHSILGKGFMITSKTDGHNGSFTLNTPFSSTREEVEKGSGLTKISLPFNDKNFFEMPSPTIHSSTYLGQ